MRPLEREELEEYADAYDVAPAIAQRDYAACRVAHAIASDASLASSLAFKGGFVLRNGYHSERASKDMDATVGRRRETVDASRLKNTVQRRCSDLHLRFERGPATIGVDSVDLGPISYRGPLSEAKILLELSRREHWIRDPVTIEIDRFGIPPFTIQALMLEEMIAEKWRCLLQRAPRRPGDPYDIWYLWTQSRASAAPALFVVDAGLVCELVPQKIDGGDLRAVATSLDEYRPTWENARGDVLPESAPSFEEVADAVTQAARRWTSWR